MKTRKIILVLIFISVKILSQVGINTESPKAMLDVNGNLRVHIAEKCLGESCGDSILVKTNGGYVQTISRDQMLNSNTRSYVSGTGNAGTIVLTVSGIANWLKVLFDKKNIDENNDFDTSTSTFTAPKDGIYEVFVQLKTSSTLSAGEFGVGIYVKRGTNNPQLIAEESYVNVSLLGIDVTPPTRKTQTMVTLKTGDKVFFCAKTALVNLSLLSDSASLFTIYQIK